MTESNNEHRIFIVNEPNETPFVTPETRVVGRGDQVQFVVVGEKQKFLICPESSVFRSIEPGEDISVGLGSPATATVSQKVEPHSVHRYEVQAEAPKAAIDPILVIFE